MATAGDRVQPHPVTALAGVHRVRHWPGMRSEYAWVRPHPGPDDKATMTGPHQIGVAFTGHRDLVHSVDGRTALADIVPGSVIVSGEAPITWLRVLEITEAVEIYPDPELVGSTAATWASRSVDIDQFIGARDGTVLGIGSMLRRAHVGATTIDDVTASMLAHRLVEHLLNRYGGLRIPPGPARGLLGRRSVERVVDLVEHRLSDVLTLEELAEVAHLSPFHFARSFARTTGLPPQRFVASRRMDRARHLLWSSDLPVEDIARAVGYGNLSHFRRIFQQHHGVTPSALRGGGRRPARTARIDLSEQSSQEHPEGGSNPVTTTAEAT